jgi:hypothetical protein
MSTPGVCDDCGKFVARLYRVVGTRPKYCFPCTVDRYYAAMFHLDVPAGALITSEPQRKATGQGRDSPPGGKRHPSNHPINREPSRSATRDGKKMLDLTLIPATRAIGAFLTVGGVMLAQANPPMPNGIDSNAIGLTGIFVAISGIITFSTPILRAELQERRAHELARLRVKARIDHNREVSEIQQQWIIEAVKAMPGLPAPPKLPEDPDHE